MRTRTRRTLWMTLAVVACLESGQLASAQAPEIGAVIQRTYRGATAAGDQEATREIYFQDEVYSRELVKTGVRGSTELQFLDNTHLVVGPNGEVRLDEFVYDPGTASGGQLSLRIGAFRYQSGELKNKENVRLVTPTATMTIRGTHLVIFVSADGATEVNVIEGAVDVLACNTPSTVAVNAGQRINVTAGCATSVAGLRALPRDYVPQSPDSAGPPIGDPSRDGPNDGPEPESEQRN
jgi:hypothetical protein